MNKLRRPETPGHKILLDVPPPKRAQLSRKIKALGGFYIDSMNFEKSATHLVTDTIKCSEKFLGACVRGLWVLPPKYIEDSFEVGMWLEEEDYEYKDGDTSQRHDLIAAAQKWRMKVSFHQEQPFKGMQVALLLKSNSIIYERLLLYGGAHISKLPLPLCDDINLPEVSLVFMDLSYKNAARKLEENGFMCLHYTFIVDTIIKDEELDVLKYLVRDDTSDSWDRKPYHLMGRKDTCIVDIGCCSQASIQEIKACNSLLEVIDLTMDSEPIPLCQHIDDVNCDLLNDTWAMSDIPDLSADNSHKSGPSHSINIENKIKYYNRDQLNKSTLFQTEDRCEMISKAKVVEQTETTINKPDRVEKVIKDKSSIQRDCNRSITKSQKKLTIGCLARKLVSQAKKRNILHKSEKVNGHKPLPLVQANDHYQQLSSQQAPTNQINTLTQRTRKHLIIDETMHRVPDVISHNSNNYGSGLDSETRPSLHTDSQLLYHTNDSLEDRSTASRHDSEFKPDPSLSVSLKPNIYLYGLRSQQSLQAESSRKINTPVKRSASQSSLSSTPLTIQTSLESFGFFSLSTDKGYERKWGLSEDQASSSTFSIEGSTKQVGPIIPFSKMANVKRTRRGLTKRKALAASLSQTDITVKQSPPWSPCGGEVDALTAVNETQHNSLIVSSDNDSDSDNRTNERLIKINNHPCKSPSFSISLSRHPTMGDAMDINKPSQRASSWINSSILVVENPQLPSCSKTDVGMFASCSKDIIINGDSLFEHKLSTVTKTPREIPRSGRSLFESILNYTSDEMITGHDEHMDIDKIEHITYSKSNLNAETNVFLCSGIKLESIENHDLPKNEDSSDEFPLPSKSFVEDYIDLPTPPSIVISSDSETDDAGVSDNISASVKSKELDSVDGPSVIRKCESAPESLRELSMVRNSVTEVFGVKNQILPSESLEISVSYPGWHSTYPVYSNASTYTTMPSAPSVYGQWMESDIEMGYYDFAINHATPIDSRAPTSVLLTGLVQLVWCGDDDVSSQAVTYLYSWLGLHPPVIPATIKIYTTAFELTSENSPLIDVIRSVSDESKHKKAVVLLEYFVAIFEVNFDFCLRSGNKNLIQNCLIVKWLRGHSYSVVYGGIFRHLLELFEKVLSAREQDYIAYNAVCALLSMACECLRLSGVHWDQHNPKFIMESVMTLSRDLAKRISSFCTSDAGDNSRVVVLSTLKLAWLKTLISAMLLSNCNTYLLSDPIHVQKLSLSSIVTQYFLLVPELELSVELLSPSQIADINVEHNYNQANASNHAKEMHDSSKSKPQKGALTADKVNKKNGKGESLIHLACMKNKTAELEKLLDVPGADVNLRDNSGWTPLHEACNHGNYVCVELLLKYVPRLPVGSVPKLEQKLFKVEIDAAGPGGLTPFQDAVRMNRIDVCRLLLGYGGQKLLKSKTIYSKTAMYFVQSEEMRKALNSYSDSSSHLNLSISQEPAHPDVNMDIFSEIAPLSQRYNELTGPDCRRVMSRASCEEFLVLLMMLVSSYYSILDSMKDSGQPDMSLDPKDPDILSNMSMYFRLLKRHVRKLTRPEDFEHLQFRLNVYESFCVRGPVKVFK